MRWLFLMTLLAPPAFAQDIFILGEVHDNPHHHAKQLEVMQEIRPRAVVFEMLSLAEAERVNEATALPELSWSNIGDYEELLAYDAPKLGAALPKGDVRAAFQQGAAEVFGADAALYGLDQPLPADQFEARKQAQFEAHCEAMPLEMMGGMVQAQRLRDASFARTTLAALDRYGAPIVVITGNGHARKDWGMPVYLRAARPEVTVWSLGQSEGGVIAGMFDQVHDAPSPERGDPCAAFR